jgi:hypothetical protein
MMGSAYELFEMIPVISHLGAQRLLEEELQSSSTETHRLYATILSNIETWVVQELSGGELQWEKDHEIAAELYRGALLIYLHTSACGGTVPDHVRENQIRPLTKEFLNKLASLPDSNFGTIMLWPMMIVGSCLTDRPDQEAMRIGLLDSRYRMHVQHRAHELLQLLWQDTRPCAYGPYGLQLMMSKHGTNFCMS